MNAETPVPAKPKRTRLRDAQKEFSRSRIRDAARRLFYERGLEATTVDQIAEAGGFQRSTVYRYFRDKGEILADIIADYAPRVRASMETFPRNPGSPRPIERWMEDVTAFNEEERMSLSIIAEMGHRGTSGPGMELVIDAILEGLGSSSPAFQRATGCKASLAIRAQAVFLVQQLAYSCELYMNQAEPKWCRAVRAVAAANMFAFISAGPDSA